MRGLQFLGGTSSCGDFPNIVGFYVSFSCFSQLILPILASGRIEGQKSDNCDWIIFNAITVVQCNDNVNLKLYPQSQGLKVTCCGDSTINV